MKSRHTLSALALGLSLTLAGVSGCSAGDGMSVKGSSEAKELRKGASLNLDELRGFERNYRSHLREYFESKLGELANTGGDQ